MSCELDRGDDIARMTLSIVPPGRFLSQAALDLVLWPKGKPQDTYTRSSIGSPRHVSDGGTAAIRLVEMANEVRKRAGMSPLALSERQSRDAAQLAPHFFASMIGGNQPMPGGPGSAADVVALGMMAGWNVEGVVQRGAFTAAWVTQSDDLDRLLSTALEFPVGREVLLDPDPKSPSIAALFSTYVLFAEEEHDAFVKQVYERLAAARAERGQRPPDRLGELAPLATQAASRIQAGVMPKQALDEFVGQSMEQLQRSVSGWILEINELSQLEFPEDFLTKPSLGISVSVAHRRPEGDPWGRYVVLFVAAEPEAVTL